MVDKINIFFQINNSLKEIKIEFCFFLININMKNI